MHSRAPTYLTDPEVEALLNGPDHSVGRTHDTALPADDPLLTFLEIL
ncbi:MAG: hypothetical protein ACRD0H_05575 [Actinomycetes bacterium]